MPKLEKELSIKHDALAVLKILGLKGALEREVKVSCRTLAQGMDTSEQTISRRLQSLESEDLLEREIVTDGQWVTLTSKGKKLLRDEYEDYRHIFEDSKTVEFRGEVESGMGEGEYYISLDGYMRQFREKLGYEPFPGTLNIQLDDESTRARSALKNLDGIEIEEWETEERTFGGATCYPADIEGVDGHIIYPHRTHYPEEMLEVIAPIKLRDELELEDEDEIKVEVTL